MTIAINQNIENLVEVNVVEKKAINSGFALAILANILWGASFLASKYTLLAWGPVTSSAIRFGIATSFLFIALKVMGKKIDVPKNRHQWLGLLLIGTTGFGILF